MLHCQLRCEHTSSSNPDHQVYSGSPPFEASPDSSLLSIVYERGIRPARLDGALRHNVGLSETIESIMVRCWRQAADERPSAIDVSRRMARLLSIPLQQGAEPVKRDLSHSSIVQVVSSSVENSLPDPLPRHVQSENSRQRSTTNVKSIPSTALKIPPHRHGNILYQGLPQDHAFNAVSYVLVYKQIAAILIHHGLSYVQTQ